jgi:hypothetical protein
MKILKNGPLMYMPEELDIALTDRRNMIAAGCRSFRWRSKSGDPASPIRELEMLSFINQGNHNA